MATDLVRGAVDIDYRITLWVQESLGTSVLVAARGVTFLGSGWLVLPMALLSVRGPYRAPARWLVGAVAGTALVVVALKQLIGRPRPFRVHADVFPHVLPPSDPSCPSGHAAGAFAVAAFLAYLIALAYRGSWRALAGSFMLLVTATLIAASRVALGVHYPSDVAFGALVGGLSGLFVARLYARGAAVRTTP